MTKTEQIHNDIPLPPPSGGRTALTASLRLLTPGDSFAVERARRAALSVAIRREQIRKGVRFTTRLMEDGKVRVWRLS